MSSSRSRRGRSASTATEGGGSRPRPGRARQAGAPTGPPYPHTALGFDGFVLAYVLARGGDFERLSGDGAEAWARLQRIYRECIQSTGARRARHARALLLAARDLYPSLPAQSS